MTSSVQKWTVPLTKKHEHAYIEWNDDILYTETEIRNMHRHFYQPSTYKMY